MNFSGKSFSYRPTHAGTRPGREVFRAQGRCYTRSRARADGERQSRGRVDDAIVVVMKVALIEPAFDERGIVKLFGFKILPYGLLQLASVTRRMST